MATASRLKAIAVRWIEEGWQKGDEDEQIVERWGEWDGVALLRQLGGL